MLPLLSSQVIRNDCNPAVLAYKAIEYAIRWEDWIRHRIFWILPWTQAHMLLDASGNL